MPDSSPSNRSLEQVSTDKEQPAVHEQANQNVNFPELIQAAKDGDSEASDVLWEHCRKYLLTIANNDLGPEALQKFGASDVVQQSMMIANEKLPTFQGSSKAEFLAWVKRVVLFECKQETRRYQATGKRAVNRERSMAEDSTAIQGSLQVRDPHITPSTLASNHEQAAMVMTALSQLDPQQRLVIQLRNWEELSFAEIGERTNKSADASRKMWARAIARLEGELKRLNAIQ